MIPMFEKLVDYSSSFPFEILHGFLCLHLLTGTKELYWDATGLAGD